MRKIFLTAIALLSIAFAQVFGMYKPVANQWIGFLTDRNQLRARSDQFGFLLGNGTIKGTFGFANNGRVWLGLNKDSDINVYSIISNNNIPFPRLYYDFIPAITMGLAYTSSPFSIGLGYSATIVQGKYDKYNGKKANAVAHTPVLTLNALDNAFRMAIPISVLHIADKKAINGDKGSVTVVSMDAQFRYYTGLDALSQVRLTLRYGNYGYKFNNTKGTLAESFGFEFRTYFLKTVVEEVNLEPFIIVDYNASLLGKRGNEVNITAPYRLDTIYQDAVTRTNNNKYDVAILNKSDNVVGAWDFSLKPGLFLYAGNDVVYFELQPMLGLRIYNDGKNDKEVYGLEYQVPLDLYIKAKNNLQVILSLALGNSKSSSVVFEAATGLNWFLPTFN